MFGDCCVRHHDMGFSVCPVCFTQVDADRSERENAVNYRDLTAAKPAATKLISRGAIAAAEAGAGQSFMRGAIGRNPYRRTFFQLTGVYLAEREARTALKEIENFKWLEAEKAGFDIWEVVGPDCEFRAAARHWSIRYMEAFLEALTPAPRAVYT